MLDLFRKKTIRAMPRFAPLDRRALFLAGMAAGGLALYFILPVPSAWPPVTGVATAIDGDTIEVAGRRVRMQGIDAPESAQRCTDEAGETWGCGEAATAALRAMIGSGPVTCEIDPRDPQDRYGRTLGWCLVAGNALSVRMVREGFAVAYQQYLDYSDHTPRRWKSEIIAAGDEARTARRGLWRGPFQMPREWRAAKRKRD